MLAFVSARVKRPLRFAAGRSLTSGSGLPGPVPETCASRQVDVVGDGSTETAVKWHAESPRRIDAHVEAAGGVCQPERPREAPYRNAPRAAGERVRGAAGGQQPAPVKSPRRYRACSSPW